VFFEQNFIDWLSENPIEGIVSACDKVTEKLTELDTGNEEWIEAEHELLWDASSFIQFALEENGLPNVEELPPVTDIRSENCQALVNYIKNIKLSLQGHAYELKIHTYKNRYTTAFKSSFAYEFSQGDLERVQNLINELRGHIADSQSLDSKHRQRLLNKLEKLQSELHKKVGDMDRLWGLVGEAGVVLGKLGKDAKPIVDRVREIAGIVWETQARAEELPSGTGNPMLGHKEY